MGLLLRTCFLDVYLMLERIIAYETVTSAFVKQMMTCVIIYQMFTCAVPYQMLVSVCAYHSSAMMLPIDC